MTSLTRCIVEAFGFQHEKSSSNNNANRPVIGSCSQETAMLLLLVALKNSHGLVACWRLENESVQASRERDHLLQINSGS
jgi:hypothetical protein